MKKKGFTLIELLAVIVLLALIAVIAVPQILKVIDSSKESSRKSSIDGMYSAIQIYYSDTMNFSGTSKYEYKNNILTCIENCGTDKQIGITGTLGNDAIGWGYTDRGNTIIAVYKNNKCYYKINGRESKIEEMTQADCKNLSGV